MTRSPHVSLPVSDPIALIDATLLFLVQVLLAKHPDLYPAHETDHEPRPPPGTRAAHPILDAIREVHHAIEIYNDALPDTLSPGGSTDDTPF
jgi:hypothetical protein